MKRAEYQEATDWGIKCLLCPRLCLITEGGRGFCRIRGVVDGELRALGYGQISSAQLDPIEKKPLNEFHPGSMIYSIGGWGCNLGCQFCQNWSISQDFKIKEGTVSPAAVVRAAEASDSIGIAYTYNEPLISIEYLLDCAQLAHENGLVNVLVTNGYINKAPADAVLPFIDALNIDIKSMDDSFYGEHCLGGVRPVLDFAVSAASFGCHVEITNLVIPGLNDEESSFAQLAEWISGNLGKSVPLHLSAYRPEYKMSVDRTSIDALLRAREICRKQLDSVYLGNVPSR
jgi:pyruvate formate lyase activating enzyme